MSEPALPTASEAQLSVPGSAPSVQKVACKPVAVISKWARDMFLSLGIACFVILFLYQPVKVEGSSMQPGLEDQERIFINKFVYRLESIGRGDVVVFRYPLDPSKSFIKRVIAVAGDRVRIDNGHVFVNGIPMHEDYVPARFLDFRSYPETVVPEGEYFLMGDHRTMSNDSREFGPVGRDQIYGKAVFVYWPFSKFGLVR